MDEVAAIVLAAGLSRRMGAPNKLLADIGGQAMIARVVAACAAVAQHPVTVVTGHDSAAVTAALSHLPVRIVHNPRFGEGQMTSVDAGLRAAPAAATYFLALGDQPHLTPAHLAALLEAHRAGAAGRITIPVVDGARGNPIVLPAAQRDAILADPVNLGCRKLTRSAPERVHAYATHERAFVRDVDTPGDLALARAAYPRHSETQT